MKFGAAACWHRQTVPNIIKSYLVDWRFKWLKRKCEILFFLKPTIYRDLILLRSCTYVMGVNYPYLGFHVRRRRRIFCCGFQVNEIKIDNLRIASNLTYAWNNVYHAHLEIYTLSWNYFRINKATIMSLPTSFPRQFY